MGYFDPPAVLEIRNMITEDTDMLVEHGRMMHAESSFKDLPFSKNKCAALAREILVSPEYYCRMVEYKGDFRGFFVGFVTDYYFCHELIAEDLLLYVPPTLRGGVAAKILIKDFEEWAEKKGAVYTCLGTTTGVKEEKTVGFYSKLGYHHKGTLMQKRLGEF